MSENWTRELVTVRDQPASDMAQSMLDSEKASEERESH